MDEEKEICYEEACDAEETLETFNEDEYFKRQKEFFKRTFERDELRKKQRELTQKARKEVLKELGKEDTEDDEEDEFPHPIRRCPQTSEVSDEYYKQLVDDINRLSARNVRIIAIFTDKEAIKDVVKNQLSGTMVEEYLDNEATLHTLLDRIQSINISIRHGENFKDSKFGPVSKRMSDR